MKLLSPSLWLICSVVVSPLGIAAESKPAAPAASAEAAKAPSVAGSFAGTWKGGDAGGKLRIKFTRDGEKWSAEAGFTFNEAEVATTVKSVQVTAGKVELVFGYMVDGNAGESTLTGELAGDTLQGAFKTAGSPDGGTWSVKRT